MKRCLERIEKGGLKVKGIDNLTCADKLWKVTIVWVIIRLICDLRPYLYVLTKIKAFTLIKAIIAIKVIKAFKATLPLKPLKPL